MITGRDAEAADAHELDRFKSARPNEPWAQDVDGWVGGLLQWRAEGVGRKVRVYEDSDDGSIVAVVAWRHHEDGVPGTGFFLFLLAVRRDRRRAEGVPGLGRQIVAGLAQVLAQEEPGAIITWVVDPRNLASCALSQKFADDEPLSDPELPHYLEFSVTLPD